MIDEPLSAGAVHETVAVPSELAVATTDPGASGVETTVKTLANWDCP